MTLTPIQFEELIEQYAEIVLDRMDYKDMEQYVYDSLTDYYGNMTESELKDHITEMEDAEYFPEDGLFDQLVDNVSNDTIVDPKEYSWGKEDS